MATLLESGGTVELSGGWVVRLPPAYYERNGGGSWSAWGADWAVDVHIIEVGGHANGQPVSPEEMLGKERAINVKGNGWVGGLEVCRRPTMGAMSTSTIFENNMIYYEWASYSIPIPGGSWAAGVTGETHEEYVSRHSAPSRCPS
jgi:hypothetical protein